MRRMIVALLASLAFAVPATSLPAVPAKADADLWEYACAYGRVFYGTSCEGIEPPKVLWSEFRSVRTTGTIYGMHFLGTDYVLINVKYAGQEFARTIILHESMHYLLHQAEAKVSRCESEVAARRVMDAFRNKQYDSSWEVYYGCRKS